jgi:DNA-directed RNA polymerase subunit F
MQLLTADLQRQAPELVKLIDPVVLLRVVNAGARTPAELRTLLEPDGPNALRRNQAGITPQVADELRSILNRYESKEA